MPSIRAARVLLDLAAQFEVPVAAPPTAAEVLQREAESWPTSVPGLAVAGIFAFLAAAISLQQIYQHVTNYEDPLIQRYYIRIVFLIPNYALASFFSLAFDSASLYIETIRDMYEAFVIYTFMSLLLDYIGGAGRVEQFSYDKVVEPSWLLGTCCLPPMQVNGQFVRMCKRMVLQFVVVKPLLAVLVIVLYDRGHYDEGSWALDNAYPYTQALYNICYGSALLGLLLFYTGTRDLLRPYKPLLKFVVVKSVVFVTFWQGILLSILLSSASGVHFDHIQNWLLCLEMLPAAVAMLLAFPAKSYTEGRHANPQRNVAGIPLSNIGNVITITDVYHDLRHQFVPVYSGYTCYDNVDEPERTSKIYRARTYVLKDTEQAGMAVGHEGSPAGAAGSEGRRAGGASSGARTTPSETSVPIDDFLGRGDGEFGSGGDNNGGAPAGAGLGGDSIVWGSGAAAAEPFGDIYSPKAERELSLLGAADPQYVSSSANVNFQALAQASNVRAAGAARAAGAPRRPKADLEDIEL